MENIIIIGAGKSSSWLIKYLSEQNKLPVSIKVADRSMEIAQQLANDHERCTAISLDVFDKSALERSIKEASIVISMLPARFHIEVAKTCLKLNKNMITASYVSKQMEELHDNVKAKGLTFLNEIGVDPGIDHMSAMEVIDKIKEKGGKMLMFESFTGGLVAPESDNNLWHYKFTWNPRNVVLAGQGGAAEFIQEGKYKYIPYQRLFRRTEFLEVPEYGKFEGLANRNSLAYRSIYGLEDIPTIYRGTLRRVGFSKAWNVFVQLGMTDDTYQIQDAENMTYREFVNLFLPYSPYDSIELKLRHSLKIDQDDLVWEKLLELDLFSDSKELGLKEPTPAQALQKILEDKWTLDKDDKDMIVMYHKFGYDIDGQKEQIDSTMVCIGDDQKYTAMAKTVGLPVGIATLGILQGKIRSKGVLRPTIKEIYQPILKELRDFEIVFNEREKEYLGYNPDNLS